MTSAPVPARPRRYRVWSLPTITAVAMISLALTAACVYFLGHRSLLVETDRLLTAVATSLFIFLSTGLYLGARIRKSDAPKAQFNAVSMDDWTPDTLNFGSADFLEAGAGEGCLGAIVSLLLSVVVAFLLVIALWLLVNIGAAVTIVLFLALGWVFHRALRQVFRHSRTCKGRLTPTLAYAALYTTLYTGWLFALVHATHYVLAHRSA